MVEVIKPDGDERRGDHMDIKADEDQQVVVETPAGQECDAAWGCYDHRHLYHQTRSQTHDYTGLSQHMTRIVTTYGHGREETRTVKRQVYGRPTGSISIIRPHMYEEAANRYMCEETDNLPPWECTSI